MVVPWYTNGITKVLCIPWYFQEQDATTLKHVQEPRNSSLLFFEIPLQYHVNAIQHEFQYHGILKIP